MIKKQTKLGAYTSKKLKKVIQPVKKMFNPASTLAFFVLTKSAVGSSDEMKREKVTIL
jgi:hypothetical protein